MIHWSLFFYLVFYSLVGFTQDTNISKHEVQILSSNFTIYGKTNVSAFLCKLYQDYPAKPIEISSRWSDHTITFNDLKLSFSVDEFDCGLEVMSNDLKEVLKSDLFPLLFLQINDIEIKKENQDISQLDVLSSVEITLAGVSRTFIIQNGQVINHTEHLLTLTGNQRFDMKHFNIEPPVKFFGAVKVASELKVEFEINMEVVTQKK